MGSALSLVEKGEPLVLPTDRWLEMVGAYSESEHRSTPTLIRMDNSTVENPFGCVPFCVCKGLDR